MQEQNEGNDQKKETTKAPRKTTAKTAGKTTKKTSKKTTADGKKVRMFRLSIVDHQTHKQLWSWKFTKFTAIVTVVTVAVCLIIVPYLFYAFTPMKRMIPGFPNAGTRKAAIQNAIKVDSLERVITRWELYSENVRRMLEGVAPLNIDSLVQARTDSLALSKEGLAKQDSTLRAQVLSEEQFELTNKAQRDLPIEGIHFFSPLKGVISQGYDPIVHPYVDITAPQNSVVTAVLDGTVIFAGWVEEVGYTIEIQHSSDIVTIYKHNNKLLKNAGDKVNAGTPIALVGGTGTLSTGDHLHFELWYKGEPVDPTKYINF